MVSNILTLLKKESLLYYLLRGVTGPNLIRLPVKDFKENVKNLLIEINVFFNVQKQIDQSISPTHSINRLFYSLLVGLGEYPCLYVQKTGLN